MKGKHFKRILAGISVILLLAGCSKHEHTFEEEWQYDANTHWHQSTCGHDVKGDESSHTFTEWDITTPATEEAKGSQQRTCTVCAYLEVQEIEQLEHTHRFADTWESDANTHWHPATCGHDVKGSEAAHTAGSWTVKTPATADADGEEEQVCTVCARSLKTRPIYHKDIAVAYPFKSGGDYTVTDNTDGIKITAAVGTDNYTALYLPLSSCKVALATAYTFVIRNDSTTTRAYLRLAYRNTTVNPRTYGQSSEVSAYSIESLNENSGTKIKEYKSDYIRFYVAVGDTAKFTMPMVANDYDQFVLMLVTEEGAQDITIIQTGVVMGEHHFSTEWSSDDNNHWRVCSDENCNFINEKGSHTWVTDESRTPVPATEESDGLEYKICSVCEKTKEVVIPAGGSSSVDEENDISNSAYVNSYNASDLGITESVHSANSVKSRAIQFNDTQDTGRFNLQGLYQDLAGKKLVFDVKVGEGALSNTYLKLQLRTGENSRYEISLRMSDNPAGVTCTALTGDYADWSHYEINVDTAVAGKTPTAKTGAGEYGFVGAHVSNTTFYFDNMYLTALA